uniref:Demethylsterigmatocystin 6-O-methyltransferase n=1 Tax=Talaromyces marneffei PM1 TaxID=1077442 RepID=A0A093VD22_TALMA
MAIENGHSNRHANGNGAVAPIDESIAIKANAIEKVPQLLEELAKQGKSLTQDGAQNRRQLLETVHSLSYALETPREAMIRYCWSQPTIFAAIELSINLGLFKVLAKGDKPKTAVELAEATGAEPVFLSRILKHLGAMGAIYEVGPDTYQPTNFAKTLTIQRYADAYPCMTDCINSGILAFPQWVKKNGYQAPTDGKNSAIWMDHGFYPVQERLAAGLDISAPLLVDVGGSTGHDLQEFRRKHPEVQGKFVLQDLPEVIEKAKLLVSTEIEAMEHDFFKEQPIKDTGARAYYMHSILHDWPDNKCKEILTNLAQAMKPGYSKVLINENVIPDMNADWQTTSLDFIMMTLFASQERTARQWQALVESAGLKIVNIITAEKGVESLIDIRKRISNDYSIFKLALAVLRGPKTGRRFALIISQLPKII